MSTSPRRLRAKKPELVPPNTESAYRSSCAQLGARPDESFARALAHGSDAFSTRGLDASVSFPTEKALFALCDGLRSSVNLRELELYGLRAAGGGTLWTPSALNELVRALNQAPNITRLSLASSGLGESCAAALGSLVAGAQHVQELNLSSNEGLDVAFAEALARGLAVGAGRLRRLDISNLPALLPRAAWGPEVGRMLASQPHEQEKSITSLRVSVHPASVFDVLSSVARSQRLTSLGLTHARLGPDVLLELVRSLAPGKPCAHVRELDLSFAYIGDEGAAIVVGLLRQPEGAAGRSGRGSLPAATSAQQQPLASNAGGGVRASPRRPGASEAPRLRKEPSGGSLAASSAPPGLRRLVLAHCNVYAPGGSALLSALESNQTLSSLDLSSNPLGDQFARHLAALLENARLARPLCALNLGRTFIADAGVALLHSAVRANPSITALGDLSDLPALVAPRRLLELAVAENAAAAARRGTDQAAAARAEVMALLPAEEAELRSQLFALRGELRLAQLQLDDGSEGWRLELERAGAEALQANLLLEATIARNKQLRERCSALELELERQQHERHDVAASVGEPEPPLQGAPAGRGSAQQVAQLRQAPNQRRRSAAAKALPDERRRGSTMTSKS